MCDKQTAKKYTSRPSPPYSANECCGQTKKGNDGKNYISKPDKNKICRWVPSETSLKKGLKQWFTLDNGGRPFKVVQENAKTVKIYSAKYTDDYEEDPTYPKLVKQYSNVEKIFVGKSGSPRFDGNSILLCLSDNQHVFIGDQIYEFTPIEPIIKYYSLVGNSSVPYPVAISKTYAYFMLGSRVQRQQDPRTLDYVERTLFPKNTDWSNAYDFYYHDLNKNEIHRLKRKQIHKRIN